MVAEVVFVLETAAKFAIICGTSCIPRVELTGADGMMSVNNCRAIRLKLRSSFSQDDPGPTRASAYASCMRSVHAVVCLLNIWGRRAKARLNRIAIKMSPPPTKDPRSSTSFHTAACCRQLHQLVK